jgi:hypothetical protein
MDENRNQTRKVKITIITAILVFPMFLVCFVNFASAAGQTTISGSDLSFASISVEQDIIVDVATPHTYDTFVYDPLDMWHPLKPVTVTYYTHEYVAGTDLLQLDSSGAAGNFRVDYAPAGLISATSQLISFGDGFATYLTDAVFEETLNVYTVTPPESVQTRHTDGSINWLADRRYSIDVWNGYFDTTPGHSSAFLGQGSVGGTFFPWPTPNPTDVNNWRYNPEVMSVQYDYWTLNGQAGYIDSFKNLKIKVGLNPLTSLSLTNTLNQSQKISFGVDNWTVTSVVADQSSRAIAIGEYDVSFTGLDRNSLSLNIKDNVDPHSIVADFEAEAQIQNTLRSYTDAVSNNDGFGATPTESTVQNMQMMTPAFNKVMYSGAYDGSSSPVTVNVGCWVRPEVRQWVQHASVQTIGFDLNGALTTPLDIRTHNDYYPSINGGPGITNSPSIVNRVIDRLCQVQARNYVAQFKIRVGTRFASTATFEGITSKSILGLPNWQQGNIAVDLGIRGDTGLSVNLLHQAGFGDFVADVQTTAGALADIIMQYVWIIVLVVAVIAVFLIVRKFTRK